MKKIVQMLLVVCMVVLSTQVAFANYDSVTVQEGADLSTVKRIAVAAPLYTPVDEKAPNKEMLTQIVSDASRVSRDYVISYDAVAEGIRTAINVDIKALDRRQAAKIYKENVANYADAYVVLTVANNSRTTFFFDVFKAGTNELLYTYEIRANKSEGDTVNTYNNLSEQFYKNFDRSVDAQLKGNSKKK
ncbi:MAG: coenzyme F(420) biosynthesis enzyme [Selenomonas sp.]|uniref:coenzyme F(420) biosynthesis enzyme n=1 Tax=Selenomonas sp. TaxID=2053611 RepID=UPI0025E9D0E4|nr:coenzyme F(420) biosynthesis enzyme [Selenomonas sp.]MCR5756386.1 coenzyme F(420) biosynthesis enzyme [Selenomonas sp.]